MKMAALGLCLFLAACASREPLSQTNFDFHRLPVTPPKSDAPSFESTSALPQSPSAETPQQRCMTLAGLAGNRYLTWQQREIMLTLFNRQCLHLIPINPAF